MMQYAGAFDHMKMLLQLRKRQDVALKEANVSHLKLARHTDGISKTAPAQVYSNNLIQLAGQGQGNRLAAGTATRH